MTEEPVISIKPQTDFELLLYAKSYCEYLKKRVKALEYENGVLKSELDESRFFNGQDEIKKLKEEIRSLNASHRERKITYTKLVGSYRDIIRRQEKEILNLKLNDSHGI